MFINLREEKLSSKNIFESDYKQSCFLRACGHLKSYIYYETLLNAQPGDYIYQKNKDEVLMGAKYLKERKNKSAKTTVRYLMKLRAINGFLKSYNIKTENGYYEDQDAVIAAFESHCNKIGLSLDGRRFFDEANRLS